ncbi:MAG: hypothetical protein KC766_39465, partial [Myxococcales bacterium]|nr:hypothetical protein [Myxococcales bacterium]
RVVYSQLPGEAGQLGAGYVVGRLPAQVDSPLAFFKQADDKDKAHASVGLVAGAVALAALLGLVFSFLEHTRPINTFKNECIKLSKGEIDQLTPSKFSGIFRKIASDINDGIDQVVSKGGGSPRRAADLGRVLGDIPDQPVMSAFSFPGDSSATPAPEASSPGAAPEPSKPKPKPRAPLAETQGSAVSPAASPAAPPPKKPLPKPPGRPGASAPNAAPAAPSPASGETSEAEEWRQVYEDFVATKQQCGEKTEGFTYEKFEQTLKKTREALMSRHQCSRVKFSVYVKDGKAALKASPIKE